MRRNLDALAIAAAALAGVALILACSVKYGPAIGPDSINYMAAARNLLAGRGFLMWDGAPFAFWPPLFPMLLAGAELAGLEMVRAAALVNAICFAGTITAAGLCARRCTRSTGAVALAAALMLVSPVLRLSPLIDAHRWMLAEPLFLLLVMVFLLNAPRLLTPQGDPLLAGAVAAAACLTRYIGVTLIATGGLLWLLGLRRNRAASADRANHPAAGRVRLAKATFSGVIAVLGLGVWLARNCILTGTLTGERLPPDNSLAGSFTAAGEILGSWWVPFSGRLGLPGIALVAAFGAAGAGAAWLLLSRRRAGAGTRPYVITLLVFTAIYTLAVVVLTSRTWVTLQSRMLSPIYPPMVVLAVAAFDELLARIGRRAARPLRVGRGTLMCAAAVVIVLAGAARSVGWLGGMIRDGSGGLSTVGWHESPMVNFVRSHRFDKPVFSNSPEIFLLTDAVVRAIPPVLASDSLPLKAESAENKPPARRTSPSEQCYIDDSPPGSDRARRRLDEFRRLLARENGCYVAYFEPASAPEWFPVRRSCSMERIGEFGLVSIVARFADGAVYHITARTRAR